MDNATRHVWLHRIGFALCAVWLGVAIDREIFEHDPGLYGFHTPTVEAALQACVSDDSRQRFECTEAAILAQHRASFLTAVERSVIVFAPPLLVAFLVHRLARPRPQEGDYFSRVPPPIKRWRVR
jgi:hypothetical protein